MASRDGLWTAAEAAAEVGVERDTIYTWVRRGVLAPAGQRGREKLFDLAEVFACEASRKHKHRRKS
ncbi:helix-turn-helix domain-containing protein [Nonomuraea sp. NPDC004354]